MILGLGLLLAAAPRIPTAPLCVIAFGLAVMRGAANAGDIGSDTNRLLFAAGLACAGYAAITLTMAYDVGCGLSPTGRRSLNGLAGGSPSEPFGVGRRTGLMTGDLRSQNLPRVSGMTFLRIVIPLYLFV